MRPILCPYCGEDIPPCPPPCAERECARQGHYFNANRTGCLAFYQRTLLNWEQRILFLEHHYETEGVVKLLRSIREFGRRRGSYPRSVARAGLLLLENAPMFQLWLLENPSFVPLWNQTLSWIHEGGKP